MIFGLGSAVSKGSGSTFPEGLGTDPIKYAICNILISKQKYILTPNQSGHEQENIITMGIHITNIHTLEFMENDSGLLDISLKIN